MVDDYPGNLDRRPTPPLNALPRELCVCDLSQSSPGASRGIGRWCGCHACRTGMWSRLKAESRKRSRSKPSSTARRHGPVFGGPHSRIGAHQAAGHVEWPQRRPGVGLGRGPIRRTRGRKAAKLKTSAQPGWSLSGFLLEPCVPRSRPSSDEKPACPIQIYPWRPSRLLPAGRLLARYWWAVPGSQFVARLRKPCRVHAKRLALLLRHGHVTVERGTVLNVQPADLHVTDQAAVSAEA